MNKLRRWLWLLLLVPIVLGLLRLRFDVEVLNLLPDIPVVQGLKIFQERFSNARELILTVRASDAEQSENAARIFAEALRKETNLVEQVIWQPPWLEHPEQSAELLAHLWLNQPPEIFSQLTNRLAPAQAAVSLAAARAHLATSMSPEVIALSSYDPFGLTKLPENVANSAPQFGQGQEMFASKDGTFRMIFIQSKGNLTTYRDCLNFLVAVKKIVQTAREENKLPADIALGYTGRAAFVAEISSGMEHDMTASVGITSAIIAALFWIFHRRIIPMIWLLVLLALILASTLALGGLLFGAINVVSLGFAGILLGLAVDYGVVHYQEALASPNAIIPEIRRGIRPSIFWAAVTTISAFLVLNFSGLPGLAQLGSLVALGVALSALVMLFAFLPPLFRDRMEKRREQIAAGTFSEKQKHDEPDFISAFRRKLILGATAVLIFAAIAVLIFGFPRMDETANALRPKKSSAYAALDEIKKQLAQNREPLWLITRGQSEGEVGRLLDEAKPLLEQAVSNGVIASFNLPTPLWPRPENQSANRSTVSQLLAWREELRVVALAQGFSSNSLMLANAIFESWNSAVAQPGVVWPTNEMSRWIYGKVAAHSAGDFLALGFIFPPTNSAPASLSNFSSALAKRGFILSGWDLLGYSILKRVQQNLWKVVVPMVALILLSLWLAFRRPAEIFLSLAVLAMSGLCLLAVMRLAGWSWNLLNLMALPLMLGSGVDYSIFMQLALRRHSGNTRAAHQAVGRALLLCGGTAIAGFGSLSWSTNAGMASLGQVCAVGIAGNMLISVYLLPIWWRVLIRRETKAGGQKPSILDARHSAPSSFYTAGFWKIGLLLGRRLPRKVFEKASCLLANIYWLLASHRREIVIENLLPALNNDRVAAKRKARKLFQQFALKLVDLWRFESGLPIENMFGRTSGFENFITTQSQKRGVLFLTPHLGNWEFGGPWLTRHGVTLQVVTLAEPGEDFTKLRQASRARWNIETLVIGNDPFAFLEIIRRLDAGATVALLVDRPPETSSVTVNLFGRDFPASLAAAELARATNCILLPVYMPRVGDIYEAHVLPQIIYDRATLRDPKARQQLTQEIVRAFEPILREYLDQWFHFVPIWPPK